MSDYFAAGTPGSERLTVHRAGDTRRFAMLEGIEIAPVLGAAMNVNVVHLAPGAVAPVHSHDEEQIGYVVSGTCVFTDGADEWLLAAGDVYHCPPQAPHGATAGGDGCVILDAFTPPRAGVADLLGR